MFACVKRNEMDSELLTCLLKFIEYFPDYLSALSRTLLRFFGQPLSKQLYTDSFYSGFSHLGLKNSLDLYKCAKAFADIVIPQVSVLLLKKKNTPSTALSFVMSLLEKGFSSTFGFKISFRNMELHKRKS